MFSYKERSNKVSPLVLDPSTLDNNVQHGVPVPPPDKDDTILWQGRLLRLSKRHLKIFINERRSEETLYEQDWAKLEIAASHGGKGRQKYQEYFMQQALGLGSWGYLDSPLCIYISDDYARDLVTSALQSGRIPSPRMHHWKPSCGKQTNEDTAHLNTNTIPATIILNYEHPQPQPQPQPLLPFSPCPEKNCHRHYPNTGTLSIEIKPKAGYLPSSPLVHPLHRAKYHTSRFQLLQELFQNGVISKGWCQNQSQNVSKSNYDPLDLFSGCEERIQLALEELWSCPQNNFRISFVPYGDNEDSVTLHRHEWDWDQDTMKERDSAICQVLRDYFDVKSTDSSCDESIQNHGGDTTSQPFHLLKHHLLPLVTSILKSDPFLPRLKTLQQHMDVLDTDGAVLVYQRLLDLCDGSHDIAQEFVDQECVFMNRANVQSALVKLNQNEYQAEFDIDDDCFDLVTRCGLQKWDYHGRSMGQRHDQKGLDKFRDQTVHLIKELNKQECVFLLQNWLISVSLNDLSFFVTIRGASLQENEHYYHEYQFSDDETYYEVCESCYSAISKRNIKWGRYSIKAIDIDCKPATKLAKITKAESKFKFSTTRA